MTKDQIQKTIDSIKSFGELIENFDGYGGTPPSNKTVELAVQFLNTIPEEFIQALNTPCLIPSPYGTITIEWECERHSDGNNECFMAYEIGDVRSGYMSEFPDEFELDCEDFNPKEFSDDIEQLFILYLTWNNIKIEYGEDTL